MLDRKLRFVAILAVVLLGGQTSPGFAAQSIVCTDHDSASVTMLSGLGVGMLALRYRNEFLRFMNDVVGFNLFPSSIYQLRELPAEVVASDVTVICGVSLVLCILAGVLPALRAAWLQPVEALRHG